MEIKVLGPGCAKCDETERVVRDALAEAQIAADIEHVKDFKEFAKYGVFTTPAVVIDGKAQCVGKVPRKQEVLKWLGK